MVFEIGRRTGWLRLTLVPSQMLVSKIELLPDGDGDPTNDVDLIDGASLRFAVPDPVEDEDPEIVWSAADLDATHALFTVAAEDVNTVITRCGSGDRRVRFAIGDIVYRTGLFEIDGPW